MLLCYKVHMHMLWIPERSKSPHFANVALKPRSLIHYYWILMSKDLNISALA